MTRADTRPPEAEGASTATQVVRDYLEAVFRRGREPMPPVGFQPNWVDQPSRHKTYLDVTRLPLPAGLGEGLGASAEALLGGPGRSDGPPWTLADLATLLRLSAGVLQRRLTVSWNQDSHVRVLYPEALWCRGTASGGGMYPVEVYWVAGPDAPVLPGVYHYSTAHHALERLVVGDRTAEVAAACRVPVTAGGYLVAAVRFWKNSFKYNSFCYHVVTQDTGALLGNWELLARGTGRTLERLHWFDDDRVAGLLGLDLDEEAPVAVVPVPFGPAPSDPAARVDTGAAGPTAARPSFERSSTILTFPMVEQVHRAVLADRRPRPDPLAAVGLAPTTSTGTVDLPAPPAPRLTRDLGAVIRARHSSFGAFVGSPPLGLDELGTVLAAAARARHYRCDTKPVDVPMTGLFVLANRVAGLPPGAYGYDPDHHRLSVVSRRDLAQDLQRNYYLSNYNLDQVGAVLAISARSTSALDLLGSRGYRVINAEVGAVAQSCYVAASALQVGCGAVLGFDNISIDELVGLAGGDERTFLFVLLGHERTDKADFDHSLG